MYMSVCQVLQDYKRRFNILVWKKMSKFKHIKLIIFLIHLILPLMLSISAIEQCSIDPLSHVRNPGVAFDIFPVLFSKSNHHNSLQHYLLYASHICLLFIVHYSLFLFLRSNLLLDLLAPAPLSSSHFPHRALICLLKFKTDHVISPMKTLQMDPSCFSINPLFLGMNFFDMLKII